MIRYATIDGAGAVGLGADTGSGAPKQADIVVLRADTPNIYPVNDAIGAVVWGMDTSNDWVFVAGRPVMRNGVLDADLDRARGLAATVHSSVCFRCVSRPRRDKRRRDGMSQTRPSSAVTSFVVGSRYMPVYLALILLVVVASIWAPAT